MIKINPKESTILNFKVDVSGSNEVPKSRLIIPISEKISLAFEGKIRDGEVEVNVSEILEMTDSKKLKGRLEVIVEGSIFYPWEDMIEIKEQTSVNVENVNTSKKDTKIKVTSTTIDKKVEKEDEVVIEVKKKKLGDMFGDKL